MIARADKCGQICFHVCAKVIASFLFGSAGLMFVSSGPTLRHRGEPCGEQQASSDLSFSLLVLRPRMQLFLEKSRFTLYGKTSCHKHITSSSAFFFFLCVKFFHPHLLTLSLFRIFVFLASFLNFFHLAQEYLIPSKMLAPRLFLAKRSARFYRKQ